MSTFEFNQQVSEQAPFLKGFAYNFTRNRDEAMDLIQDTMLKAFRYRDNYSDGTNLRGWLFTIMRNIFINSYKRKALQRNLTETPEFRQNKWFGQSSDITIGTSINEKDILKAISTLNEEIQVPFKKFIEGFHYEEIAQELAIPIGTVKSRIFHARKKLSNQLQDFK